MDEGDVNCGSGGGGVFPCPCWGDVLWCPWGREKVV